MSANEEYETYVLCGVRSAALAKHFLDAFLPLQISSRDEFPIPEYGTAPRHFFDSPELAIQALEQERHEAYGFYWHSQDPTCRNQAMLFFTEDEGMIVGFVSHDSDVVSVLQKMANTVGGEFGYVAKGDCRPPDTTHEFIQWCQKWEGTRLVDGKVEH